MDEIDVSVSLEYIDEAECWRLLAREPVGRVGVIFDSGPEVYPVNHLVDGGTIVFRTDPGSKLDALEKTPSVCYEVDGLDPTRQTGWSVLVKGRASEVPEAEADALRLEYWAIGPKAHCVRIVPTEVTGRRIYRHGPTAQGHP
jgi:uncharacterized protein